MKKLICTAVLIFIGLFSYTQNQIDNLNMGLYQLQFSSANGGNNRIQSYGGTFPGTWLFKSRFDNIVLDAGENENNRFKIIFKTGNIERAQINSNGNFGIGTTTPKSPLTIGYNNGENQLAFKRLSGNETFTMNINSSNQILFKNHSGSGDYDFQTNVGGKEVISALFIKGTNGNIGIGTLNPDMKLTVNGNIHAKEIKIDLKIPAPDYVFRKNYKLRNIENVERFIKKNNHLPEIPSAKAFKDNGLKLAEMDMNLLKKIEELTLYTIQQHKEIKKQKENVEKLTKEIKLLTSNLATLKLDIDNLKH